MELKFIVLFALVSAVFADVYDPIDLSNVATIEERWKIIKILCEILEYL